MRLWISLYLPEHGPGQPWYQQPDNAALAAAARQKRQASLQEMALGLLQYTPNLAFLEDRAIVLDVSASLSLFHGPRKLWQRIQATLENMQIYAWAGMAPTAMGAWLLACQTATRQRRILSLATLARRLAPLPVRLLSAAQPYLEWLDGIGCQTLAQLRLLPRVGLQQRSSPLLIQALDAAYGDTEQYFTWFNAPEHFSQRYELTQRLEHTGPILAVSKRLIEQLCGWLHARQLAVSQLTLLLHHEQGRHARPPTTVMLRLSENAWLAEDFLGVLGEQLQAQPLDAGVIAIELSISQTAPRPIASASLFPEPAHWLRQEQRVLDLLRARLGAKGIWHARPLADYRPEQANRWEPDALTPEGQAPPRLAAHSRPFWLLPAPVPLETKNERPIYQGKPLHLTQGPERLESGWWDDTGHQKRDYFIAQDQNAVRYWVYRVRESQEPGWFLHGLFA